MFWFAVVACRVSLAGDYAQASSADYPTKAIRFVVPFAPGGGTDIIARIVAQRLNESLGQPVVIDNRGGAGSTLGTDIVTQAPPDGYTILLGNISLAFNAWLYQKLPYNAIRDLASEDTKQKFDAQGLEPLSGTTAELGAYLRSETEKWGKVVRAAGIPLL